MPTTLTNQTPVLGIAALVEDLPVEPHTFRFIDSLPSAREAIEKLTDEVVGMAPLDLRVAISSLRMDQNGRVCRLASDGKATVMNPDGKTEVVGGGSNYTATGLAQLVSFFGKETDPTPRSATSNLYYYPAKVRAFMFNEMVSRSDRKDNKPLILRFLNYKGRRMLRAVCSEVHTLRNGDTHAIIARLINRPEICDGSAKASLRYGWDRVSLDFYFPRTDANGNATGPVPFVRIALSETKDCSWTVVSGVFLGEGRIALATKTSADMDKTTGRHVGTKVGYHMAQGYDHARTIGPRVLKAIEASQKTALTDLLTVSRLARECEFEINDPMFNGMTPATVYDVARGLMDAATKTDDANAHRLQLAAARVMQWAVVEQ